MAGRYHDVASLRLSGNRWRAQQHVPAARLLMGQVMEQAAFNDLGIHRLIRQQADGTLITAEKIGTIARLSIHAPGTRSGTRTVQAFDDLLVTGGVSENENGQRVRLPVIVSHDKDMHWQAYFAHRQAPGYYAGADTYGDVFPALETHPRLLSTRQLLSGQYRRHRHVMDFGSAFYRPQRPSSGEYLRYRLLPNTLDPHTHTPTHPPPLCLCRTGGTGCRYYESGNIDSCH